MQIKLALAKATRVLGMSLLAVAVASPVTALAQDEEEEATDPDPEKVEEAAGPAAAPPPSATTPPPPPAPPAPPPSPFSLQVKGFVSGSIMMQDGVSAAGNYNLFLFNGVRANTTDKWMYGGDVRQSQLKFFITGPTLIGAVPQAGFDFDMLGGQQIQNTPGLISAPTTALAPTLNAMGMPVVDAMGNIVPRVIQVPGGAATGTSAQGDENILPRVRLAYLELNWNAGEDILRIGQFHNLIVPMIPASLGHIGAPLGYGAGQLGWRAPGITYQHTFKIGEATSLSAAIQLNRNNWADNIPTCPGSTPLPDSAPAQSAPGAATNCLPNGVSFAEASALPQIQARVMLSGPPKPSPFPLYAPNAWQLHLVGVWDQKDASGVGLEKPANATYNDTLTTAIVSAGFKATLGPVLVAGHGWYGKNAGSLFGHIFAMQHPQMGNISGFGGWGQAGFSFTQQLTLWFFGGIDKPNKAEILKAMGGSYYTQNVQLCAMLSFVAGPLAFSLEYMRVMSDFTYTLPAMPERPAMGDMPAVPAMAAREVPVSTALNQIALSGAFFF
jgi:hypothetical protein